MIKAESDIVERLRRKVFHGPTMEAVHTRTVEWQAADEIERLRASLDKAKEALRPFSSEAETWDDGLPDDAEMTIGLVRYSPTKVDWTLGDLRRAAATLKEIDT